ncbi:succinate dehydrogenase/fumarate reductase flavoprotein subunit [Nocardioides marinisabuli]|uniref:Succinate dehydrogenase/fumarate reductase flavoprotein subunit n=1 Tax=Nocardioides marinisabuli TaxID=419476 RepID=A0A7Y9F0I7_9ACTN|nr:FAD-binding protein [Nocardioides marinisabuli]NYD57304.1 succinate dehydrogenase/fumarate reductase flavoprotein subunit [Nocardioides marinisabuli]
MSSPGTTVPETIAATDVAPGAPAYDVVVVGFGIAGGCAALEAARAGARVLLLERAAVHGGTSSMSGGHFYLGGGTAVQRATGHDDSVEDMVAYLTASSKAPDATKIRAYCEGSVAHFDWLEALGFEFERSYYPEKAVIQPGTQGLMYTGNEKVWPFRDLSRPAPRGHKVPVAGDTEGTRLVMDLLRERVEEAGVEVRYETGAAALVLDETGTVRGVGWRSFERTGVVLADAVVLAAGGFVMNPDMVAEHTPALAEKLFTLGSTYDDGLGIRLGRSAGAALQHMDEPFITAPVYPPATLLTGVIVNNRGERFVAEDSYHSRTSQHVIAQPGSEAYLVVDSEHVEYPAFPLAPLVDGYETLEELETSLGLPIGSVRATLARYDEHAARGEDPDFHKHPQWLAPQSTGPWAVFDLRLGKALYAGFTLGGIATDVDGRALRPDGSPVTGLFAAGACASNLAQDGNGYCSGTQLGEGSFFGRRAGVAAAARARNGSSGTR